MSIGAYMVKTASELNLKAGSKPNDLLIQLYQFGSDGWELVTIVPLETDFWLVFKK